MAIGWKSESVTPSYATLCNSMDCSPSGSSVDGILQARIREWVAMPFSKASSQPRDGTRVSCSAGRFFTIYQNPFHQGWCQFIDHPRSGLFIAFLSLSTVPLLTVHSLGTHTVIEWQRTGIQACVTGSKTRAFCYPRLALRMSKL